MYFELVVFLARCYTFQRNLFTFTLHKFYVKTKQIDAEDFMP